MNGNVIDVGQNWTSEMPDADFLNSETVSGSSVPVTDSDQSDSYSNLYNAFHDAFTDILEDHFITIEDNQITLYDFFQNYFETGLTEEEIKEKEENELLERQYKDDLLNTLHSINSGIVSQNALIEENNRLLQSLSANTVSENSISQNAILSTKFENYSLTDSLLLIVICVLLFFGFVMLFVRRN